MFLLVACAADPGRPEDDAGAGVAAADSGRDASRGSTVDAAGLDGAASPSPDDASGLDATSATSDAGGPRPPKPPPGNALLLPDGTVAALYPVTTKGAPTRAVGFVREGTRVHAIDEDGQVLWDEDVGEGALFGGFDFDADGWPDLGLQRSTDTGKPCGESTILDTWIDFAKGVDGSVVAGTGHLESLCWTFPGTTYPTHQWSPLGILFGAPTKTLAAVPYYAKTGTYLDFGGGAFSTLGTFHYPSTPDYDATYVNDRPNVYGDGKSYTTDPHIANGLVLSRGGTTRLVFFTSARVVEYALGPLGPDQLLADTPFITAGRTDLVGRDYGLVVPDPGEPDHLVLVSGTSADTVFRDMQTGKMESDPWGQIERHVTIYSFSGKSVDDRFFSYAHDGGDAKKYEGRVVYPNDPFVRTADGQPSRLAFNVYEGGHWRLHVTAPGTTVDAVVLDDMFLWDIRDLDGDGKVEWALSPSRDPTDPNTSGWYFVKWRTLLADWQEATVKLVVRETMEGTIPFLQGTFREPERTTSRGSLFPLLTTRTSGGLALLVWKSSGTLDSVPLGP